jgi:hypothetical protein
VYLVNVRKSLTDHRVHAYHKYYVVYGRKPEPSAEESMSALTINNSQSDAATVPTPLDATPVPPRSTSPQAAALPQLSTDPKDYDTKGIVPATTQKTASVSPGKAVPGATDSGPVTPPLPPEADKIT